MAQVRTIIEPRYLYRYRSVSGSERLSRELSAIRDAKLWCSHFESLNDPMEGSYEASVKLRTNPDYKRIEGRIFGAKNAIGICSFSETNDHELMWAHYADQFAGICIEYFLPRLLSALDDDIEFVRLNYVEKSIRVYPKMSNDADLAKRILSTKSHRWLYEREWRMFSSRSGLQRFNGTECISCIYIGNRISDSSREAVLETARDTGIRCKIMSIDGYSIGFKAPAKMRW